MIDDYLTTLDERLAKASPLPWKAHTYKARTNVIHTISTPWRVAASGLLNGNGGDIDETVRADSELMVNARIDVEALVRALRRAAGSEELANFILAHSYKEILQEAGLAKQENIFKMEAMDK